MNFDQDLCVRPCDMNSTLGSVVPLAMFLDRTAEGVHFELVYLRSNGNSRGTKTIVASWHCHPESFCASGKCLRVTLEIALGSFQMVWKVSG